MNDYYDDDDDDVFMSFPSDKWKEFISNMGITYEVQNDYIPDIYEGPLLVIEKEYDDFDTFFNESKEIIYRKMIDLYETIKDPSLDDITLTVLATIDDSPFNSNFSISKNTSELLMDVIIPFFESTEEYETCDRALKLYHYLQGD
jgi:hypothetical protein